jgi:hypothetical protein
MATIESRMPAGGRLGVVRCGATGAAVMVLVYALCWAGAALGAFNVSHMYLALFTNAPIASTAALMIGLCWSAVFGALAGTLTAITYNAFAFLTPR